MSLSSGCLPSLANPEGVPVLPTFAKVEDIPVPSDDSDLESECLIDAFRKRLTFTERGVVAMRAPLPHSSRN